MRLPQFKKIKWNYTALAFAFPVVGMLLLMLVSGYEPFGSHSMLYSDMYHQYYPFFVNFRKALLSGDSLLYSWNVGMGMDYLGLISYYLASPLNLLSILVPEGWTLEFFSLLGPVKLGLAGLFFAIFLKKIFRKDDLSITLFGCLYALCAWALGYQWNVMWLDTFALLPLVALGTVSLLQKRKFVLYTVTLFLSVYSNYYIGFFTCIFVLLLFICYEICRWQNFRRFITDLGFIALFSLLAIGMTAILELPALAALQTTQSSVNKFPKKFDLNIASKDTWQGLLDAMRQVAGNMNGGVEPTFKEGLPNLYCGVLTNILAFLFLTCRQVKLRDRICSVVLLLFFNVSFILRQLDYIWHGFHFTNMIPYRFSFLYSFVMLYMAYRAWLLRNRFRLWQVATAILLSVGLLLCCNDLKGFMELVSGKVSLLPWSGGNAIYQNMETIARRCTFLIYTLSLLLLYGCTLIYASLRKRISPQAASEEVREYVRSFRDRRSFSSRLLLGIMALELCLNLINFGVWFAPGTGVSNYPKGTDDARAVITYMQEREADNLFFRAETTHSQTLNDGAINGYNGISTFTSSANVKVTEFMRSLGYGAKNTYNRYCFEESSPVANLFLGLKYMIERDNKVEENPYFDEITQSGSVHLLENNAYLPLGFLANSQLVNVEFTNRTNRFQFQNELMQAASGISAPVWTLVGDNMLTINGTDVTLTSQTQAGHCTYGTQDTAGSVTYSYTADRDGFLCIDLELSKKNSYKVYKNSEELYSETYSLPQMIAVCQVTPGDVIEIRLNCKANEKGTLSISAAILDEEIFRRCYDVLAASTMELTDFTNTRVEGTVTCDRDGVLYTSIPQDGNWVATVDGQPAQIVLIGGAMNGLILEKGTHIVCFTYENRAFSLGWKISLGCALVFSGLYLAIYKPKRKPAKYARK